jgi:hypothetical protein
MSEFSTAFDFLALPLTPPTPNDDNVILSYADLLSALSDLQSTHNALKSHVTKLEAKDTHWVKVFAQVEKGMSIKLAALDSLKQENHDLKVYHFLGLIDDRLGIHCY